MSFSFEPLQTKALRTLTGRGKSFKIPFHMICSSLSCLPTDEACQTLVRSLQLSEDSQGGYPNIILGMAIRLYLTFQSPFQVRIVPRKWKTYQRTRWLFFSAVAALVLTSLARTFRLLLKCFCRASRGFVKLKDHCCCRLLMALCFDGLALMLRFQSQS